MPGEAQSNHPMQWKSQQSTVITYSMVCWPVYQTLSWEWTLVWASISTLTTSACPLEDAVISGVLSFCMDNNRELISSLKYSVLYCHSADTCHTWSIWYLVCHYSQGIRSMPMFQSLLSPSSGQLYNRQKCRQLLSKGNQGMWTTMRNNCKKQHQMDGEIAGEANQQ